MIKSFVEPTKKWRLKKQSSALIIIIIIKHFICRTLRALHANMTNLASGTLFGCVRHYTVSLKVMHISYVTVTRNTYKYICVKSNPKTNLIFPQQPKSSKSRNHQEKEKAERRKFRKIPKKSDKFHR